MKGALTNAVLACLAAAAATSCLGRSFLSPLCGLADSSSHTYPGSSAAATSVDRPSALLAMSTSPRLQRRNLPQTPFGDIDVSSSPCQNCPSDFFCAFVTSSFSLAEACDCCRSVHRWKYVFPYILFRFASSKAPSRSAILT